MTEIKKYALFIQDYLDIKIDLPYEIIPGFFLKKPDEKVISMIENLLKQNGWTGGPFGEGDSVYKTDYKLTNSGGYSSFSPTKKNDWRYYIVEYSGDMSNYKKMSDEFRKLKIAFYLSKQKIHADLFIGFSDKEIKFEEYDYTHLNIYYEGYKRGTYFPEKLRNGIILDESYFKVVKELFELLNNLDSKFAVINSALKSFNEIKNYGKYVSLRYLCHFIIWEQIITHKPNPTDPTNSIGRQIKSKLNLINNRAENKFDLLDLVAGANVKFDTIISKLYDYRSDLAHGNIFDFSQKYSIFKDQENLLRILDDITRKLLFASLKEPMLVMDLKEC